MGSEGEAIANKFTRKELTRGRRLTAAALFVFLCTAAHGASITVWTLTDIRTTDDVQLCGVSNMVNTLGAVQTDSCGFTNGTGTSLTGTASASGVPGEAKSLTQINALNTVPGSEGLIIYAGTDVYDEWQILVPMNVTITMQLFGSPTQSGSDPGYSAEVIGGFGQFVGENGCAPDEPGSPVPTTCTFTTFLSPGIHTFDTGMSTRIIYIPGATATSFTGTEDYFSSMTIIGLSATDLSDNPIDLSNIISSTGLPLTSTGYAVVPEPATLLATAAGLAMVAIARRRSARRGKRR